MSSGTDHLFSRVRWQISSMEKLKASAKATASQSDCLAKNDTNIIIRQKMLTTTVNAFFSEKYFLILSTIFYKYLRKTKLYAGLNS
jgi:hypothetical protein